MASAMPSRFRLPFVRPNCLLRVDRLEVRHLCTESGHGAERVNCGKVRAQSLGRRFLLGLLSKGWGMETAMLGRAGVPISKLSGGKEGNPASDVTFQHPSAQQHRFKLARQPHTL